MSQLMDLLQNHLSKQDLSVRAFCERSGMNYQMVLALLNKGSVPRKAEHRETLRRELGLDQDGWATVLASSQKSGIDIPSDGPLTLQQLIMKSLFSQGFTEQSFAIISGIPYPTLMGITRKGAVPRTDTLVLLAEKLGLTPEQIDEAVTHSKTTKRETDAIRKGAPRAASAHSNGEYSGHGALNGNEPHLSQLVADHVAAMGGSVASYARAHEIPYLSLTKLLNAGIPPRRKHILDQISKALSLGEQAFETSLIKSKMVPMPASARRMDANMTPLQEALHRLVHERALTTKAFADLADLSVLTASKLLKKGDLPGRTTTHEKLRNLLGLGAAEYGDLLARSRSASAEAEHANGANEYHATQAQSANGSGITANELADLLERLSSRQRDALKQLILSML